MKEALDGGCIFLLYRPNELARFLGDLLAVGIHEIARQRQQNRQPQRRQRESFEWLILAIIPRDKQGDRARHQHPEKPIGGIKNPISHEVSHGSMVFVSSIALNRASRANPQLIVVVRSECEMDSSF